MDIQLQDFITGWLLPPGGLVLLLLLGLLMWRRLLGRLLVLSATVALYLLSTPQVNLWLAAPLETDLSADAATLKAGGAQAILVFLAGRDALAPELGGKDGLSALSLQRLHHAVRLHRQNGLPLALSGGTRPGEDGPGVAQLAERELETVYGLKALIVETYSSTTRGNAFESARLLAVTGINRVALVTHAWHMPRARYSAEQAGLSVIPAGTGYVSAAVQADTTLTDWLPSAAAFAISKRLLHEHLGMAWYRYGPGGR